MNKFLHPILVKFIRLLMIVITLILNLQGASASASSAAGDDLHQLLSTNQSSPISSSDSQIIPYPSTSSLSSSPSSSASDFSLPTHAPLAVLPASLSCADLTSVGCFNCSNYLSCHWCVDGTTGAGSCHTLGSPFGCLIGASCAQTASCMRSSPESIGYGPLPVGNVMIFVSVCLAGLTVFLCCFYGCCYFFHKRQLKRQQADSRSIDLMPYLPPGATNIRARTSIHEAKDDENPLKSSLLNNNNKEFNEQKTSIRISTPSGSSISHEFPGAANWSIQGNRLTLLNFRKSPFIQRFARCMCIFIVICVVLFIILGIFFFPSAPQYSICSKRIDWTSVLGTLKEKKQLGADVQLLASVYNPNRFSLTMSHIEGIIKYKNTPVGSGQANDLEFPSGSVVDFLLTTHLSADLSIAAAMYNEHLRDALLLDIKLKFAASVWFFSRPIANFNTSYTIQDISPDQAASKTFCKCKDS